MSLVPGTSPAGACTCRVDRIPDAQRIPDQVLPGASPSRRARSGHRCSAAGRTTSRCALGAGRGAPGGCTGASSAPGSKGRERGSSGGDRLSAGRDRKAAASGPARRMRPFRSTPRGEALADQRRDPSRTLQNAGQFNGSARNDPASRGRPHMNFPARRRVGAWRLRACPDAANPIRSAPFRVDYATIRARDPPADAFGR